MPEGPEVAVVRDAVKKGCPIVFEGASIIENVPGKIHRYTKKKPKNWEVVANNRFQLINSRTKGKLILLDIETLPNKEPWVLLITLGMSGDLRWNSSSHKHCRFSLLTHRGDLSFVDTRCFGTLRIMNPKDAKEAEKGIGWDFLNAPLEKKQWSALQKHRSLKDKEVGPSLLNQKFFAGVGNIYKSESLLRTKIHPKTLIKNIPEDKWLNLNYHIHDILQESYKLKGCSVVDFTADGIEGKAQTLLRVYLKSKCPRGHKIKTIKQEGRTTWFCPECQK